MNRRHTLIFSIYLLSFWVLDAAVSVPAQTSVKATSAVNPVVSLPSPTSTLPALPIIVAKTEPRSIDVASKQSDLDYLEVRKKALLGIVATRELEKKELLVHADQEWEKGQLPKTTKYLDDAKAAIAEVDAQIQTARQQLTALQGNSSALPPLNTSVSNTTAVTKRLATRNVDEMQADLASLQQKLVALDQEIAALKSKIAANASTPEINMTESQRFDAEFDMINLQALVGKRGTLLQLITNLMNSISEAMKAVAKNVGK